MLTLTSDLPSTVMVSARQSSTSVGVWEKHNKVRNIRCGKFLCDGLAFISCRSDCDWLVCSWRILGTPEEALGFNVMWATVFQLTVISHSLVFTHCSCMLFHKKHWLKFCISHFQSWWLDILGQRQGSDGVPTLNRNSDAKMRDKSTL